MIVWLKEVAELLDTYVWVRLRKAVVDAACEALTFVVLFIPHAPIGLVDDENGRGSKVCS
jgi:hypothetical protein